MDEKSVQPFGDDLKNQFLFYIRIYNLTPVRLDQFAFYLHQINVFNRLSVKVQK